MNVIITNLNRDKFINLDVDVIKSISGEFTAEELVQSFSNFFFNRMFLDITAIKDYKDLTNLQKLSMGINMDKVILFLDVNDSISDSGQFLSRLVSMGIYNFTKDANALMYLYSNPNSYRDVAYYQDINNPVNKISEGSTERVSQDAPNNGNKIILGVKNITDSAGSTTLVYMINKILKGYYNTKAVEIDKRELMYFNDNETLSIKEDEFDDIVNKYSDVNFFVVDLGKSKKDHLCSDVIYLVEPTTIKLNKLI